MTVADLEDRVAAIEAVLIRAGLVSAPEQGATQDDESDNDEVG